MSDGDSNYNYLFLHISLVTHAGSQDLSRKACLPQIQRAGQRRVTQRPSGPHC